MQGWADSANPKLVWRVVQLQHKQVRAWFIQILWIAPRGKNVHEHFRGYLFHIADFKSLAVWRTALVWNAIIWPGIAFQCVDGPYHDWATWNMWGSKQDNHCFLWTYVFGRDHPIIGKTMVLAWFCLGSRNSSAVGVSGMKSCATATVGCQWTAGRKLPNSANAEANVARVEFWQWLKIAIKSFFSHKDSAWSVSQT